MEYKRLGNFVNLRQGLAINAGTAYLVSSEQDKKYIYPLLRIADMEKGIYSKFISNEVSPSVIANKKDIIYTRTGQIGLVFRGFYGVVHNNSFIVSIKSDEILADYLYMILNSKFVREQAIKFAKNSVQPDLTHDMFKSIVIPVPTLDEQLNLSKTYNTISLKIQKNSAVNNNLAVYSAMVA